MKNRIQKYLLIFFLIVIFQINLFNDYDILIIASVICLSISFMMETWNDWNLKKTFKILIYFLVFLIVWIISYFTKVPWGTTIFFSIAFNLILKYIYIINNEKKFYIYNLFIILISMILAWMWHKYIITNEIGVNIISGAYFLMFFYQINKKLDYAKINYIDIVFIIIGFCLMISGPIYHINKLEKAISINNQVIETMEQTNFKSASSVNEMENKIAEFADYKEDDLQKKYYGKYDEFEKKFIKSIAMMIQRLKEQRNTSNIIFIKNINKIYEGLIETIKNANEGCEELKDNLEIYKYIYGFIYLISVIIIFRKNEKNKMIN